MLGTATINFYLEMAPAFLWHGLQIPCIVVLGIVTLVPYLEMAPSFPMPIGSALFV